LINLKDLSERLPPSVLKHRFRSFPAVYPRLTGGTPVKKAAFALFMRLLDFAPDEACLSAAVTGGEGGSYPAFSPLPDRLNCRNF